MIEALLRRHGLSDAAAFQGTQANRVLLDIVTATSMSAPAYKDYGRRILDPALEPTFPLYLGLKDVELGLNADYRIVTVALQPDEPMDVGTRTLNRYLTQYARPEARGGWRILAGSEQNVKAFADAIGFSYYYDADRKEYAHPAAVVLASPDGKISRYLYGLEYAPKTLRLALVEASEGRVGTTIDRLILYCYHYDSSVGRYAPVAQKVMQLGGAVTVVLLGIFLTILFRADAKKKRHFAERPAT